MKTLRALAIRTFTAATMVALGGILVAAPVRADPTPSSSLVVLTDFVLSGAGLAPGVPSCVQSSRFAQGAAIVFRTRVIDGTTGHDLSATELSGVQITLDNGTVLDERYSGHPGGPGAIATDYFWSAAWTVPADYPTGTVDVTITASAKDGRTGTWVPFNVDASRLTIVPATPDAAVGE